jgi:hypothetical protein
MVIYSVVDHLGFWTIRDRLDSIYMYEMHPCKSNAVDLALMI